MKDYWKSTAQQAKASEEAPKMVLEEFVPDRAQIAAIMAHALITKGQTKTAVAKEAVALADQLLAALKETP